LYEHDLNKDNKNYTTYFIELYRVKDNIIYHPKSRVLKKKGFFPSKSIQLINQKDEKLFETYNFAGMTFTNYEKIYAKYLNEWNELNIIDLKNKIENYYNSIKIEHKSKNCYIATLVYKDIDHPRVEILRNFRDNFLIKSSMGRLFVYSYYKTSPKIVIFLKKRTVLQSVIMLLLNLVTDKLIKKTKHNNV
jgi:Fe-S oxidoreductase